MLNLYTQHMLHKNRFVTHNSSHRINGLSFTIRICNMVSNRNQIIFNITSTYISTIIASNECTTTRSILHDISHALAAVVRDVGGAARWSTSMNNLLLLLGLHRRHITHLGSWCSNRWCRWWLINKCLGLVEVGMLWKRSSGVGSESLLLSLSLYFPFTSLSALRARWYS
jgi:hypothetical protein